MEEALRQRILMGLHKARSKIAAAEDCRRLGHLDDAISRCYYAMYHAAAAVLSTRGIDPRTHQGLLTMFGEHFIKSGLIDKRFLKMLRRVKEVRENGDYGIAFKPTVEETEETIAVSKEFVSEMERFLTDKLSEEGAN